MCHTQKSYVSLPPSLPPAAAATPPAAGNPSSFTLARLFSNAVATTTITAAAALPLLYIGRPTFLFLFLSVLLTRCPAFAAPFLYPPPRPARRVIPPYSGLLFRSFSRRGNRLSLRRTCSHSSRTIERKRGRKRYFSRTARTSASAVNSGRPDRGENFAKYRGNASRASLGSGRSDHRINRTFIGHLHQVGLDPCARRLLFRELTSSEFPNNLLLTLVRRIHLLVF